MELTDKQKIFVSEYVVDFNATRAAIKAGYSKSSARQMGTETLSKPYVREAINKVINELNEQCNIKREKVINEIASIAFDDISNYADFSGDTLVLKNNQEIDTRNISEISIDRYGCPKIKLYNRDTALYKLAEYLGLDRIITENQEVEIDPLSQSLKELGDKL